MSTFILQEHNGYSAEGSFKDTFALRQQNIFFSENHGKKYICTTVLLYLVVCLCVKSGKQWNLNGILSKVIRSPLS